MKAALFYGGKNIHVDTVPDPIPGPREILVKVRAAAVCGSDLHPYHMDETWDPPRIRGHELAGEVAFVGPEVSGWSVGDRVGVEPLWCCGTCNYCMAGKQYLCSDWRSIGVWRPGGFAQYTVAPPHLLHRLPDNVSFEAAALLDVYSCAVHAQTRVPVQPGDRVAIVGSGAIGLSLAEMAHAAGAAGVAMLGRRQSALDFAATVTPIFPVNTSEGDPVQKVLEWSDGMGADVVYEAVGGHQQTLDWCIGIAAMAGRIGVEGAFTAPQTIDARLSLKKELTIAWIQSYDQRGVKNEYDIALQMTAAGRFHPDKLVTHRLPLDRIKEAFELADNRADSQAVRVVLDPWA